MNLHFQQQTSVTPPQSQPQAFHQLHQLRHNEPETSTAIPSTSTINSLINAERIPSNQMLGLNAQEASILNFLRVDAAEKQRDRRYEPAIVNTFRTSISIENSILLNPL